MTEYVVVARTPESGLEAFLAYESAVLPLLSDHGGRLDRRLRSLDERTEVHLLSFADDTGLTTYRGGTPAGRLGRHGRTVAGHRRPNRRAVRPRDSGCELWAGVADREPSAVAASRPTGRPSP